MIEETVHHLASSKTVLIVSHSNPDGDAVSSTLALGLGLEQLGKTVTLMNESQIPAVYRFLPSVNRIARIDFSEAAYDTAVVLDCGDLERIGSAMRLVQSAQTLVNIDHHVTNTAFGDFQVVDPKACATAELVYRVLDRLKVNIDSEIATAIYTGILTDTGSFRFSNTNQAAFSICTEMAEKGVNPYAVAQHVYGTYSLGRIKLLNLALDSIEISGNGKLSIMTVTQDMLRKTNTQPEDMDGLIHYARRIEDVKVAAMIQEVRNGHDNSKNQHRFHVSLRSDGSIDVASIAAAYGGGGHSSAAGFGIAATLKEVKSEIAILAEKL